MSTMRRLSIATLAAVTLLGTACGDDRSAGGTDDGAIRGVTWVLDRASIDALVPDVPGDARIDIRFEDGQVSGRSACNSYGGTYEVDGDALTFGPLGGTEMACQPPALMELEAEYLAALDGVEGYGLDGDALVLASGERELRFQREDAAAPKPLVGTRWELESLAYGADAVASPIAGADAFVRFGADGDVGGSTGCNTFGGRYQVGGDAIAIGEIRMTLKACAPDIDQQEDVFHRALLRAGRYGIEGDTLTLSDGAGAFLVSFTARGDVP
jgi:heat shock protein HslJ